MVDGSGAEPATNLSRVERMARTLGRLANETARGKRMQTMFLRSVSYSWMRAGLARRMFVDGLERAAALRPERGVLLVSNHRSFFDRYVLLLALLSGRVAWARDMIFPVPSTFLYDHPMGMVTNMLVGAGALWPPFDDRPGRRALDHDAMGRTVDFLARPDSFVAVHAAGSSAADEDPYELLTAHPDAGRIALEARPLVLPVFVNGLSDDLLADVRANFRSGIRRDAPCIAVVGEPIDLSDLQRQRAHSDSHPELWGRAADLMRDALVALGERERCLRARCAAGGIGDDHPGWLSNRGRAFSFPRFGRA
ncbi:hypothetical protein EYW49_21880 [Siculibacillus lacustris]|uniref:Phospholipid/glycerol acyltransferase domain-containing protein n=1 Tax=Siculibacillus lacustris TaxID=1549641 RepID=A0A4Q9VEM6_9HYPH|nr:1-acyl-sn-glycerol-3-phosphate acyltransferase [Siculibacillus lacustris]TBW32653.1 hypothetical protein EYW49_21880 [Siculibacillus lacustris]